MMPEADLWCVFSVWTLLNDRSLSLLANFYHPCSRWCGHCHQQHGRPSATGMRIQDSDLTKSNICSQDQIDRRLKYIEKTLGNRVVPQASKEHRKREYLDETRKKVLNEIGVWARTHSDTKDTKNCWWITGQPAVGKSTIGVKVAETFENEKSLYAQYFVTRNIQATTDPENILPTMAQQLAENSLFAAQAIEDKLRTTLVLNDVKKFSVCQAQALLLEPLQAIAQHATNVVVVIDGVDELANTEPSVLSEVTSVLCSIMSDLPANVKILIFSRPEQWITDEIPSHIKRHHLATEHSEDDVDRLVREKLKAVAKLHKWNDWPSDNQVRLLCQHAAGHLGLAATALRWIARQIQWDGRDRRDEVIEEVSKLGNGDLYELYSFIFDRILPPPKEHEVRKRYLKRLKAVLGCLVILQEPLDIGSISTLLSPDFEVLHYMKQISSLIVEGTEPLTVMTVPQVHKSVVEYLVSSSPHPDLHIDPTEHHHSFTTACFETIQKELTFNIGGITTSHDPGWKISSISPSQGITYPCRWLGHHLENGGERATLVPDVKEFMETHFLHWLEVLSLQKLVDSVAVSTLEILEKEIKVSVHVLTKYSF
jgi:nucleoside-triphosphatase THEP1